jgi:hypothetical protein
MVQLMRTKLLRVRQRIISTVRQMGSAGGEARRQLIIGRLGLLIAALLAFSMWFFVDRIWAPPVEMHFSDLYPRWYGSRELLLRGRDPYGPAVSREIQTWAYGHPVDPGSEPRDETRFAYPLYVAFLLAPTIRLSFSQVQNLARVVLPVSVFLSVPLWIFMLRWRCSRAMLGTLILLSFGSFPALESLYLQQPVLLAAAFLAASGAALTAGHLWLAGGLLALATIKPQLSTLPVAWFLLWAFSDWRTRKKFVWGFGLTMSLLLGLSELLLPGWIGEFVAGAIAYQRYTGNFSILALYLTNYGAVIVSSGLVILLIFLMWRMRVEPAGSDEFNFVLSAVVIVTLLVVPTVYPTGQVILLPALFLLVKDAKRIWMMGRAVRLTYAAVFSLIAWPWAGALAFMVASLVVPLERIRRYWITPLGSVLLVPVGMLVLFAIIAPTVLRPKRPPALR